MRLFILICLLFNSLLQITAVGQDKCLLPLHEGESIRYDAYIEMPQAYISGICILLYDEHVIKGSLINEFGITAIDFIYYPKKEKVKLCSVFGAMDKWYIHRVLRKDLAQLLQCLKQGETQYINKRRNITYNFKPVDNAITQ